LQVDPKTTATGAVQGVVLQNGTPEILVNGTTYLLSQVTAVAPTTASSTPSPTTSTTAN
jgi:hypothetical protein